MTSEPDLHPDHPTDDSLSEPSEPCGDASCARPSPGSRGTWSWKVADPTANETLGLRYEPGNWGDILKGTWAVLVTRWLCGRLPDDVPLRVLDPYAGAPEYPLVESAARRLEWLGGGPFVEAQVPFLERGALASTGELIRRTALDRGREVTLDVFDADPARRERWREIVSARVLDLPSGDDALRPPEPGQALDLVLVDPYDFFSRWSQLLPAVGALARGAVVLVYLYNKAPRGGGHVRNDEALRRRLASTRGVRRLIGRVPSDARLPRAWHEVIALSPEGTQDGWRLELERAARRIACKIAQVGAVEDL